MISNFMDPTQPQTPMDQGQEPTSLPMANTMVVDLPEESPADRLMRVAHERVQTKMRTELPMEDEEWHFTSVNLADDIAIKNLIEMGYEPAYGHPGVDPDRKLGVYRLAKDTYQAKYIAQMRKSQLSLKTNLDKGTTLSGVQKANHTVRSEMASETIARMPEFDTSREVEPMLEQVLEVAKSSAMDGFDVNEQ